MSDDLDRFIQEEEAKDPMFRRHRVDAKVRFDVPEVLRARRLALGLTQSQVATLLDVTQPTVSEFEAGMGDFHMSTVQAYARALGGRIDIIFHPEADV